MRYVAGTNTCKTTSPSAYVFLMDAYAGKAQLRSKQTPGECSGPTKKGDEVRSLYRRGQTMNRKATHMSIT